MSRGVRLSILGLYKFNNALFNEMKLPSGFSAQDRETIIGNILSECAELECLFPDWDYCQTMIGLWSKFNQPTWERIYKASLADYNPIENYNRTEIETIQSDKSETHSGNDIRKASGKDTNNVTATTTENHSGTDAETNSITAYDSNTLYVHDKSELTHGEQIAGGGNTDSTINYGKSDTFTHGEKIVNDDSITRNNHTSGNIGVTTSQQMLEQEIAVSAKLNMFAIICDSFKERFCLLVY